MLVVGVKMMEKSIKLREEECTLVENRYKQIIHSHRSLEGVRERHYEKLNNENYLQGKYIHLRSSEI